MLWFPRNLASCVLYKESYDYKKKMTYLLARRKQGKSAESSQHRCGHNLLLEFAKPI